MRQLCWGLRFTMGIVGMIQPRFSHLMRPAWLKIELRDGDHYSISRTMRYLTWLWLSGFGLANMFKLTEVGLPVITMSKANPAIQRRWWHSSNWRLSWYRMHGGRRILLISAFGVSFDLTRKELHVYQYTCCHHGISVEIWDSQWVLYGWSNQEMYNAGTQPKSKSNPGMVLTTQSARQWAIWLGNVSFDRDLMLCSSCRKWGCLWLLFQKPTEKFG